MLNNTASQNQCSTTGCLTVHHCVRFQGQNMSQEVHVGPKYSLMVSFFKIVYFSSYQTVITHVHIQIFCQLRKILHLDDEAQFAACIEDFQA